MVLLEITKFGSSVRVKGGVLRVTQPDCDVQTTPLSFLTGIILHRGVSVSTDSLIALSDASVPVTVTSPKSNGTLLGYGGVPLKRLHKERHRYLLAKSMLMNSLFHRGSIPNFNSSATPPPPDWAAEGDWRENLRAWEGRWSKRYWEAFQKSLSLPSWWTRRSSHPISSALDYLGVVLVNRLIQALVAVGIDPWSEAFHVHGRGRPSLACDMAEELRWPLVEKVVMLAWQEEKWETKEAGLSSEVRRRLIEGTRDEWEGCLQRFGHLKGGFEHLNKRPKTREWHRSWSIT